MHAVSAIIIFFFSIFGLSFIRKRVIKNRKTAKINLEISERDSYLKQPLDNISSFESSEFIFSLTSIPSRFSHLIQVVDSLLNQVMPAKEIHLNLAQSDTSILPETIRSYLESNGVSIFAFDDLGPAKKLIPTLQRTEMPVICVDDDLIYKPTLTYHLMFQHKEYPNNVIASRTHQITKDKNGQINPYAKWKKQYSETDGPSPDLFATSGAGTLFKKEFFHKDVFDMKLYKELAFYCDDLWWYFQAIRNGIDVRRIPGGWPLDFIPGTQEQGLWRTGNKERNEIILQNLLKRYGKPF